MIIENPWPLMAERPVHSDALWRHRLNRLSSRLPFPLVAQLRTHATY